MTKDWFPIIDSRCVDDCFKCLNFCPQKVYEKNDAKPVVSNPDACLQDCDSCKDICPENAISFITARVVDIDGQQVGIIGLDEALQKENIDDAIILIKEYNYIPKEAVPSYIKAIEKEFSSKNI